MMNHRINQLFKIGLKINIIGAIYTFTSISFIMVNINIKLNNNEYYSTFADDTFLNWV